jgi:hypothetical protein
MKEKGLPKQAVTTDVARAVASAASIDVAAVAHHPPLGPAATLGVAADSA